MPFIQKLIDKGYISPALGRALEVGIYQALGVLMLWVVNGGELSWQVVAASFVAPLLAYVRKRISDLSNAE